MGRDEGIMATVQVRRERERERGGGKGKRKRIEKSKDLRKLLFVCIM